MAERLRALAELEPILESPDADFGRWETPAPVDGVHRMPYFELGPTAEAFTSAVARGGWTVMGFDWMTWMRTPKGVALSSGPAAVSAIADASSADLARLVTAIRRGDRFVEGNLAGAIESGIVAAISRRAAALLDDDSASNRP